MKLRGLKEFSFTVPAGETRGLDIEGDWCQVQESDASGCIISFDQSPSGRWYEGQGRRVYYEKVSVFSDTSQTVKLLLGFGHATDARAVVNASVTTNIAPGNTLTPLEDVSCVAGAATSIAAADTDRLGVIIHNPSDNTHTLRIGDAGVTATKGVALEPGETLPIASTAQIFAWNTGASDQSVSLLSVREL